MSKLKKLSPIKPVLVHKSVLFRITTVPMSLDKLLEGQLRFMSNHYRVTAVSADKKNLERVGEKEGVKTHCVEMTREITPLHDAKALWKLYRLLKKEKPLIVHSHTPKAGVVGMLAAKLAGVPLRLHTVAGLPLLEATGSKRKLLDIVEKFTCRWATKVYPNSKGLYDIILEQGYCKPDKLHVIANGSSNGIDTNHFNPEQITQEKREALNKELGINEGDFVFVFVGRLVGDKGINELIAAFKQICQPAPRNSHPSSHSPNLKSRNPEAASIPSPRLLLVGPLETNLDPLKPETLREIETNSNIITTGYQDDVRPYLAISDALAFPSYREGFPNVVMQAGAMGLPSIVTDINGCNEIIIGGKNGTIIPPKNTQALTIAMQHMLEDNQWRNQLQENAREMIVSRYEQKLVWEALLHEYQSLVKQIQDPA